MPILSSPYFKYFSFLILIISILYKYEISSEKNYLLVTKQSSLQFNRSHVYKILADIDKYRLWYPTVIGVKHIRVNSSPTKSREGDQYGLVTKYPLIGNRTSLLIIEKYHPLKHFQFSLDSWLLEVNSIELKDDPHDPERTFIEWSVYTKRRSFLFQYLLFPIAKFLKNQFVREVLFSLMIQIRRL